MWIDEAKKRCAKATPGPWAMLGSRVHGSQEGMHVARVLGPVGSPGVTGDLAFITASRTDLPAAIARIEWQERMLKGARILFQRHMTRNFDADYTRWCRDLEGGPPNDVAG